MNNKKGDTSIMTMSPNVHVYPCNDLAPHNLESNICPCNPKIEGGLIIHNSFDKREIKESL
jgi:hypothetical protein